MKDDILTELHKDMDSFSRGQRKLAQFILDNYDKAAFMTANRLGATVGISESTVVRFATELGYDGYPGMQKALQDMVMNRLTSVQRMGVANDRLGNQDVLSAVLQADMDKLRRTMETIDKRAFQDAVGEILNAKRIYVIGVRSASALSMFLGYYLNYMFDNVHTITTSGTSEMFEKLVGVGKGDAVIAFSFPRYSSAVVKGAEYCRKTGATVIGITDQHYSPLGENCDYVLVAKSDMASIVDSLVAPLSVVNALIVSLASAREEKVKNNLDTLERVWDEYNVYEKRVDK